MYKISVKILQKLLLKRIEKQKVFSTITQIQSCLDEAKEISKEHSDQIVILAVKVGAYQNQTFINKKN